ncbi:MAG: protein kinase [Deltaproteobacteria bacterium]|nr:protein kinase [Deltaproteobacteria bacterium]
MTEQIASKYDVVRVLGKGSYGKVFLVKHSILGVPYALKLLNRSFSSDEHFIERFKQEAAILQRFSHPGSIQLRDFGQTEDGLYYMAMDYCEGQPLSELLANNGALDPAEALDITQQVLIVLEAAHNFGIIHRDIKPENIMVQKNENNENVVKILDFGVAKLKEGIITDSGSTLKGTSIGTPFYMSPEQAAGESDLDYRADIYSVGIMLYEMLTGEVPFKGETVLLTLLMHITRRPKPFAERLGLPPALEQLVFTAIEKEKDNRFPDVLSFLNASALAAEQLKAGWKVESVSAVPNNGATGELESPPVIDPKVTKILCLDDNEMILQILKFILTQQGYEVFTATDYSQIHDYLFTQQANLLLCDVQMPGVPGTKVCKMIKESKSDLKIALFSNLPDRDLEKLAKESRADNWISKNEAPEHWIKRIKEIIENDDNALLV